MKIIYNPKSILLQALCLAIALIGSLSVNAQMTNKGSLYISKNANLYLEVNYKFGATGTTVSNRIDLPLGKLSFAAAATSTDASATHFMDGYVRKYGTGSFIYPIGQFIFAPIRVIPSSAGLNGIDAAYYNGVTSTIGATLDANTVSAVAASGYWDIKGTPSNISLTWSSALAIPLTDLIIVGFKSGQWFQIPSTVDVEAILGGVSTLNASTVTAGSITSIGDVTLSDYSAFSLGKKGGCAVIVASSGITKTWTLLGWVGADTFPTTPPTLADKAIISSAFVGNLSCYSLKLDANITLIDGQLVEIVEGVTGDGKIIMSSQASVVQRSNSLDRPKIVLTKTTREMKMFDYVYWGTPILENSISQIAEAKALGAATAGAFDLKYRYQTGTGGGWKSMTTTENGRGFITRIKQQAPFVNAAARGFIDLTFIGTANNGDITVEGMRNGDASSNFDYELLANPYPGSIDAGKFLELNTNLEGSIHLWTANTPVVSNYTGTYTSADYAIWNKSGSTFSGPLSVNIDGKIASGQGFRIKVLADNSSATFTNCMRNTSGNDNFFRTSNETAVKDRYKLNMTGNGGIFSQILIAYVPQATYGRDRLYDADRNSASASQLYSLLGTTPLAINGRPSFDATDVVPLGVSKAATTTENFTISLTEQEGVFANGTATVYLHDILLGTYHDFVAGDYTFTANSLTSNNRFEAVYAIPDGALNTTDFAAGQVIASINSGTLTIMTSKEMASVAIFDITGRMVQSFQSVNALNLSKPFNYSEGIYIAKIKLVNGATATQKLINKK